MRPFSSAGRLNIVKSTTRYDRQTQSHKNSNFFLIEMRKASHQVHLKFKGTTNKQNNLKKKKKIRGLVFLDFKTQPQARVIKTM